MLLSLESGKLCGNASEPPVAVDRFRIVSTVTSGSCFLIIAESLTCNMTWRHGQITANCSGADDCSERPASLTLTCELTKLWYFPVSCKNCVKSFGCYSVQLHPRGATVSDTKLRSLFLTSRAVFLFRHAHSLFFCFHDCDWPQAFQPSLTIANFLSLNHFCSHRNIIQSPWRWRSYVAPKLFILLDVIMQNTAINKWEFTLDKAMKAQRGGIQI